MKIYPSLISAPLLRLEETLQALNDYCDGYHIDIMDDHFVPNLTWGAAFCHEIAAATALPLHVHLMVDDPGRWLARLALTERDTFIFHAESPAVKNNPEAFFQLIHAVKQKKWRVGIALSPDTSLREVQELLPLVDELLIMSVYPGFSGQAFIPAQLDKAQKAAELKKEHRFSYTISMDGGVSLETMHAIKMAGVEAVALASALFSSSSSGSYAQKLQALYNAAGGRE